ncbi:MAG: hypothetical protein ABJA82_03420 [Myxococcales bacterium]
MPATTMTRGSGSFLNRLMLWRNFFSWVNLPAKKEFDLRDYVDGGRLGRCCFRGILFRQEVLGLGVTLMGFVSRLSGGLARLEEGRLRGIAQLNCIPRSNCRRILWGRRGWFLILGCRRRCIRGTGGGGLYRGRAGIDGH